MVGAARKRPTAAAAADEEFLSGDNRIFVFLFFLPLARSRKDQAVTLVARGDGPLVEQEGEAEVWRGKKSERERELHTRTKRMKCFFLAFFFVLSFVEPSTSSTLHFHVVINP